MPPPSDPGSRSPCVSLKKKPGSFLRNVSSALKCSLTRLSKSSENARNTRCFCSSSALHLRGLRSLPAPQARGDGPWMDLVHLALFCPGPLQVPCRPLDVPSLSGTGQALRQPLGSGPVPVFGPQVVGTGPFWHRSVGASRSLGRPLQASSFSVYCLLLPSCNSLPSSFQRFLKPADCRGMGWDGMPWANPAASNSLQCNGGGPRVAFFLFLKMGCQAKTIWEFLLYPSPEHKPIYHLPEFYWGNQRLVG